MGEKQRELQQRPGGPASQGSRGWTQTAAQELLQTLQEEKVQSSRHRFPDGRCPQALFLVNGDPAGLVLLRCQNTKDQRASWGEARRHEMRWTLVDGGSKCEKKSFPAQSSVPVQPDSYTRRK